MAWGMPSGFAELIQRKYDLMQQDQDRQLLGTRADVNLANVRAGLMPAAQKSDIAKTGAETAGILESNKFIADIARSGIALQGAQAFGARTGGQLNLAQVGNVNATTEGVKQDNRLNPFRFRGLGEPMISEDRFNRGERLGLTGYTIGR